MPELRHPGGGSTTATGFVLPAQRAGHATASADVPDVPAPAPALPPWPWEQRGEPTGDGGHAELVRLIAERQVTAVFQPIVDLRFGDVAGYEAFARGPAGSVLESPAALFSRAAALDRSLELDWVCRAAAFDAFMAARLPPSTSLFVNIEAATMLEECPADLLPVVTQAEASLRVFIEVNDRALAADPAGLLAAVARARTMGWGVSIDDAGISLGCLSVLPLVRADVIKLDVRTLTRATGDDSSVVATVLRHVEASGATLVVKGIEDDAGVRLARALGADHGQGNHLGAPAPLRGPVHAPRAVVPIRSVEREPVTAASPYDAVVGREPRRMSKQDMARVARVFANRAISGAARPVVLVGMGDHSTETDGAVLEEMPRLSSKAALFVAFGVGMPAEPWPGARGVSVPTRDVLAGQSFLVLMTEHLAMAMVSRRSAEAPGLVDVVTTQDPALVWDVAEHLMHRVPSGRTKNTVLPLRVVLAPEPEPPARPAPTRGRTLWARLLG